MQHFSAGKNIGGTNENSKMVKVLSTNHMLSHFEFCLKTFFFFTQFVNYEIRLTLKAQNIIVPVYYK